MGGHGVKHISRGLLRGRVGAEGDLLTRRNNRFALKQSGEGETGRLPEIGKPL